MTIDIRIPYPTKKTAWSKYGLNSIYAGKHWAARKADAKYWHELVLYETREWRGDPIDEPVEIAFYWNDGLDLSNHAYMEKMIEDALKGRIIVDDNRKHVQKKTSEWHNEDYLRVEIKSYGL